MPTAVAPASRASDSSRLESDASALQDALGELVRVYQFRDRDRICCHDVSVTQCYAIEALLRRGPSGLNELARYAGSLNGQGPLILANVPRQLASLLEIVSFDKLETIEIR